MRSIAITLTKAEEMLAGWLEAESHVQAGQSYSIDGKSVTKANLSEIRNSVKYWEGKVTQIKRKQKGKGRARISQVVPMD